MSFNSFEELEDHKLCRKFRNEIAALVESKFPSDEKYLLKSQITKWLYFILKKQKVNS